jgi:hypothetical protein
MNFHTRLPTILRAPDGSASPAPVVAPVPVMPPDDSGLSERHLLRNEAKQRREEAASAIAERDQAKADAVQAKADADVRIAEATSTANKRIINAELRAEATKAGMVDLDALVMLDADKAGVKLSDDGAVVGAAEALAALKSAKPFLFGSAKTGNTETPKAGDTKSKSALDMTPQELAVAKKELTRK